MWHVFGLVLAKDSVNHLWPHGYSWLQGRWLHIWVSNIFEINGLLTSRGQEVKINNQQDKKDSSKGAWPRGSKSWSHAVFRMLAELRMAGVACWAGWGRTPDRQSEPVIQIQRFLLYTNHHQRLLLRGACIFLCIWKSSISKPSRLGRTMEESVGIKSGARNREKERKVIFWNDKEVLFSQAGRCGFGSTNWVANFNSNLCSC